MNVVISKEKFAKIFKEERYHLPIRWDGNDFHQTLKDLFAEYINKIEMEAPELKDQVVENCSQVDRAMKKYLAGFPADAYEPIQRLMETLEDTPLQTANTSFSSKMSKGNVPGENDEALFRVSPVDENIIHNRKRIFHTPYNLRSKIATTRYSIAGFPCLYLGTSLRLCCREIQYNPYRGFAIAARFKPEFPFNSSFRRVSLVELAVKPQDFFQEENAQKEQIGRRVSPDLLEEPAIREAYILWYPLIAACSYIRANKNDPFAPEYIVPQILMQWLRRKMKDNPRQLMGIRYFSCASERASNMGFNYVFPASGEQTADKRFCPVLAQSFRLTKPQYIHEFEKREDCEQALRADPDLQYIH